MASDLSENFARDLPWSVELGQGNIQNSSAPPQTTDIGNVQDYDAFSWPLRATDTDWQLDFDIPFTAEQMDTSTGENLTALTELDKSQFNNRSTQGLDFTGSSEELIEYLSLSEKVSVNAGF